MGLKELPHRRDIDGVSRGRPVVLFRACSHIALLNGAALEKMSFTSETEISGGSIDVDEQQEGEGQKTLTGIVREKALDPVWKNIKEPKGSKTKNLKRSLEFCMKKGLTGSSFFPLHLDRVQKGLI